MAIARAMARARARAMSKEAMARAGGRRAAGPRSIGRRSVGGQSAGGQAGEFYMELEWVVDFNGPPPYVWQVAGNLSGKCASGPCPTGTNSRNNKESYKNHTLFNLFSDLSYGCPDRYPFPTLTER